MSPIKAPIRSIVTKLIVLNAIIVVSLAGILAVHYSLAGQIKSQVIGFAEEGVNQLVSNEKLSRVLNQLSGDIQLLFNTLALDGDNLASDIQRLTSDMDGILEVSGPNFPFKTQIERLSSSVSDLLSHCKRVHSRATLLAGIDHELSQQLERIENAVTMEIIAARMEDKNYKIGALEQIAILIPDLQHKLLKIKLSVAESKLAHLKPQVPEIDYEDRILSIVSDIASSIDAMTHAGDRLSRQGNQTSEIVLRLKHTAVAFHEALRELQASIGILHEDQSVVVETISATGKKIFQTTDRMREEMFDNLRAYGRLMGVASMLALCVTILVAIYGVSIAKPIQSLTRSVSALTMGDLDQNIRVEGHDEVAVLAHAFLKMQEAIRDKISDLARQNDLMLKEIRRRKKSESDLRKYEQIAATSQDLMAIVDAGFVYQAVNEAYANMYKRAQADIVGRCIVEVTGEEAFARKIRPKLEKCLQGHTVQFKDWFYYPGAGKRFMDVAYYPYVDKDRHVTGIVFNARDVTQTKLLEEKLAQAQKMEAIGTLAGGIAHDFNNILGAILGYTELLLLEWPQEGETRVWLQQISTAADRAKQLVDQILAFSRQGEKKKRPVKLEPLIEEVIGLVRASLPTTIEIEKRLEKTDGSLMADPIEIHQVLINLCANSAHAMREDGGQLSIRLNQIEISPTTQRTHSSLRPGHYFVVSVRDTGQGIPAENLKRIFEPYFTTKEKGVGTGLGLATVHGIVQSYGGIVDVTSHQDEGTEFTVYLPKDNLVEAPETIEKEQEIWRGKGTALLVDDEKTLLEVGQSMLERLGYQVMVSDSATAAMDLFQKDPSRFDLVLTDQTMPKMTGHELAKQMLSLRSDIPVILCTGFSDLIDEEMVRSIGIRQYLKKPFRLKELSEAVRKALEKE